MTITKKALFEKMNGRRVAVTYEGMRTVDDNEGLRQSILAAMAEQNIPAEELGEDDRAYTLGNRFWMKSKLVQGTTGTIKFRSKDYIFTRDNDGADVYGDIPKVGDMEILPDGTGFTKRLNEKESITYRLVA